MDFCDYSAFFLLWVKLPKFETSVVNSFSLFTISGTYVTTVYATDRDAPNEPYSDIRYSLVSMVGDGSLNTEDSPILFRINEFTGEVFTATSNLDREELTRIELTVQVRES